MNTFRKISLIYISFLAASSVLFAQQPGEEIYQTGFLSKDESLKSIQVPEGYRLELVLSDPEIEEPVMVAWDGNGAMYVVEMRSYMQDADATGELDPKSRITRHEDTNGDGIYDKHSVFADNLVLPRFVLPLDDRIIVGMTNTMDLWTYRDTTGDGVSDETIKIYEGGPRGGNMEHQPSSLTWGLDNWLYLTYTAKRYRFTDGNFVVENIPKANGQWGLAQDNWGRFYFSMAGGELPADGYQQPPLYGPMKLNGQEEPNFRTVYPIAQVPDVQAGPRRVGANGGLNSFTGCSGQSIFRGDRLPEEMRDHLFICEPVGRLIRRAEVDRKDAKTVLRNATPGSEFIRTRDINFRPIWTATMPSGQMAIVDMHHGIIQQGNWTKPKSYLRGIIDKWGMDKNIGKGRIYRLVHKDFKADAQPKMLDEKTAELVKHLSHPNGWWRDTAQKLIILRKDRESVVPMLKKVVMEGESDLGRLHALWTLEGMGKLDSSLVAAAIKDKSSIVRTSAVRLAEPFMVSGDETVVAALQEPFPDDMEMAVQFLNSLQLTGTANTKLMAVGAGIVAKYGESEVVKAVLGSKANAANQALVVAAQKAHGERFVQSMERGKVIFEQLCFSCHGANGEGAPMAGGKPGDKLAPSFVGSARVLGSGASAIRVLLNGLTGKLDGKEYEGLMVPMANNDDQWIADAATYIRNSFGNEAPAISPLLVAQLRKEHGSRTEPWTVEELEKLEPLVIPYGKNWKLTASHKVEDLKLAFDGDSTSRYSTGLSMAPGMWVQVELPSKAHLSGVVLDAAGSAGDYPREYEVQVSDDGQTWSAPVAKGKGVTGVLEILFPSVDSKFLRVTQTGKDKLFWSIYEMRLMGKY